MSAFIIGKDQLDLLVHAAIDGPTRFDHGLRFEHGGGVLNYTRDDANTIGQILHDANVASVNYRYNDGGTPETYTYDSSLLRQYCGGLIPWSWAIWAADCLAYQACESPEWDTSLAKAMLDAIRNRVARGIANRDNAPWTFSRDDVRATLKAMRAEILAQIRA